MSEVSDVEADIAELSALRLKASRRRTQNALDKALTEARIALADATQAAATQAANDDTPPTAAAATGTTPPRAMPAVEKAAVAAAAKPEPPG